MTTYETAAQATGRPFNRSVEIFGDSRVDYGRVNSSSNKQFTARSVLSWLRFLTKQAFDADIANVNAAAGITSAQVLALMQAAPTVPTCGTVVVFCSTNDRNTITGDASIITLKAIEDLAISRGQVVVWVNETPRDGANVLTATQLKDHLNVVSWLSKRGSRPGVYVGDAFGAVVDPASAAAAPLANRLADGLHQNGYGAHAIATALLPVFNDLFPARGMLCQSAADAYDATNNPRGVLNANPMMTGTAGTVTAPGAGAMSGNLASNYTATLTNGTGLTVTLSKVTSGGKDWQQIAITGTPTSAGSLVRIAATASIAASLSALDTIDQFCEIEVDAAQTGINAVQMEASLTGVNRRDMAAYNATDLWPVAALSGVMRIGPFAAGAEAVSFYKPQLSVYFLQNVAVSATIRMRALSARKVVA
jgi:hypothetical protein